MNYWVSKCSLDKQRETARKKHSENRDSDNAVSRLWHSKNKDWVAERKRKKALDNPEREAEIRRKYRLRKKESDPLYSLRSSVRTYMNDSFSRNGWSKTSNTHDIIGCSFDFLKEHIESRFKYGMHWGNKGLYSDVGPRKWNVDHIIPLSLAKTDSDLFRLWHWTNLRPMWADKNKDKSDTMPDEYERRESEKRLIEALKTYNLS
jgi:hypothetical protein